MCAGRKGPKLKRPEFHTLQRADVVAQVRKHPADLPVLPFAQLDEQMRLASGCLSQRDRRGQLGQRLEPSLALSRSRRRAGGWH